MPGARSSVLVAALVPVSLAAALFLGGCDRDPTVREIVAAVPSASDAADTRLHITYPWEGTLFPPESVAPTFVWEDRTAGADRWYVVVRDDAGGEELAAVVDAQRWRP